MKPSKKLLSLTGAAALSISALAIPMSAQAEVSASVAMSNMYLWRGINLTPSSSVVSGSLDYSHESGAYAGIWTTSETGGTETDLYFGFGGSAGGFSYDVSYWLYMYPEDMIEEAFITYPAAPAAGDEIPVETRSTFTNISDTDISEIVASVGYGPATFTLYVGVDTKIVGDDDYYYYTLGYDFLEKFNITYGKWSWDKTEGADYSHITLSYSPVDELTFTVNKAMEDAADTLEEDPIFQVTYSKSFDVK